jgi:ribosome-associated protein
MNNLDFNKELNFKTSRSSGKGGQHVNKVETRVELFFDVKNSEVLSERQKELALEQLKNRISNEGIFQLANETARSQKRNKEIVVKRFYKMINEAITPKVKRKITRIPRSVIRHQKAAKRKNSEKKSLRKKVNINRLGDIDL